MYINLVSSTLIKELKKEILEYRILVVEESVYLQLELPGFMIVHISKSSTYLHMDRVREYIV